MRLTPNIDALRRAALGQGGRAGDWTADGVLAEYDALDARYQHYFDAYTGIVIALGTVPRDPTAAAFEVTALRARVAELRAGLIVVPAPKERPLNTHKGVTYFAESWWYGGAYYATVSAIIYMNDDCFSDDDHAPLMALRDEPFMAVADVGTVLFQIVARACRAWAAAQDEEREALVIDEAVAELRGLLTPVVP